MSPREQVAPYGHTLISRLLGKWPAGRSEVLLRQLCVPRATRKRAEDPEGDL